MRRCASPAPGSGAAGAVSRSTWSASAWLGEHHVGQAEHRERGVPRSKPRPTGACSASSSQHPSPTRRHRDGPDPQPRPGQGRPSASRPLSPPAATHRARSSSCRLGRAPSTTGPPSTTAAACSSNYPPGTDLDAERQAISLAGLALQAGITGAAVIPARSGDPIACGPLPVSAGRGCPARSSPACRPPSRPRQETRSDASMPSSPATWTPSASMRAAPRPSGATCCAASVACRPTCPRR